MQVKKALRRSRRRVFSLPKQNFFARICFEVIEMTETINLTIDSEDLKEFKEQTGMNLTECIKILVNSIKYGGKLELDPFWSEDNINELKRRIKNGKMERHDIIESDEKNRLIFKIENEQIKINKCGTHYGEK